MRWLFGFPGAGAGPAVFSEWEKRVEPQFRFQEIYWNSGIRRAGEYIDNIAGARELCAQKISALVSDGDEISLFGYSLGANVAYETAVLLSRSYGCSIQGLFVSAATSPDVPIEDGISFYEEEAFVTEMESHRIFLKELFDQPGLRKFFLPKLRADYRMIETYCDSSHAVLDCPIAGFFGSSDASAPWEDIAGWKRYTTCGFTFEYFPGDHYFYYDHQDDIIDRIKIMSAQSAEAV